MALNIEKNIIKRTQIFSNKKNTFILEKNRIAHSKNFQKIEYLFLIISSIGIITSIFIKIICSSSNKTDRNTPHTTYSSASH